MGFITDSALDAALQYIIDETTTLHICSAQPSSFANVASVTLGNKSAPTVGSLGDGSPNGRQITVSAISDGTVTGTDTATHWALVSEDELLATEALSSSQDVTSGNTFTLTSFTIRMPDAA